MDMDNNRFTRGSEWRKWDLHIHTPKSIVNNYGQDDEITWNKYIDALQRLPQNISVIGITDYYFIDGYEKVMEYKKQGKLDNIKKIFPILEFRIDTFGSGNENRLQKVNLHILFDLDENNLENEIKKVREEFIDMIPITGLENHRTKKLSINNFITEGGGLQKGFSNLVPSTKQVFDILNSPTWKGKVLFFLGYKEWSNLEKNQQLKPFKENLYSKVNAFFTSNDENIEKSQAWLNEYGSKKLFHSLDIHDFRTLDSANRDDKGEYIESSAYYCKTWIKADPTFEGLKQVFEEPENRVFIGEEPELFTNVNNNRTKYIHELSIDAVEGYSGLQGKWFQNIKIPFNKELVAIIGNKGNGKSAVADILAHCCNFKNQQYFSFLTDKKFKNKNLADNFIATVEFEDKHKETKRLSDKLTDSNLPLVEYLPQGYFETICNDLQKEESLKSEIENVVFQYLDESLRLGTSNFKELIDKKTAAANSEIVILKNKLSQINKEIIVLEDKENPEYRNKIEALISKKEQEIEALIKPQEVKEPNLEDAASKELFEQIKELNDKNKSFETEFQSLLAEKNQIAKEISTIETFFAKLDSFVKAIEDFKLDNKQFIESMGENIDEIVSVNIHKSSLNKKLSEKKLRNKALEELLKNDTKDANSPILKIETNTKRIEELQANLDGPSKAYHAYLQKFEEYNKNKKTIEGNEDSPNTLLWLRHEIDYLDRTLKADLSTKDEARDQILKEIFQNKKQILDIYQQIKNKLDERISDNKLSLDTYSIKIEASFSVVNSFSDSFLHYVNQIKSGSFRGKQEGETLVQFILKESNVQTEDDIVAFCRTFINHLKNDMTKEEKTFRNIGDQVTDRQSFYDLLYSIDYLSCDYYIMQGDKNLSVLSPGEKGALLLVFYLLLDMDNTPLILDQPEDNLDNDSIANILVDFIKKAKMKRQIIMVTHNPNLAVVADAEQIIYTDIDKKNGNKFSVECGSIENPKMNKHIVDVLEGAMPAFKKRDHKYIQ